VIHIGCHSGAATVGSGAQNPFASGEQERRMIVKPN